MQYKQVTYDEWSHLQDLVRSLRRDLNLALQSVQGLVDAVKMQHQHTVTLGSRIDLMKSQADAMAVQERLHKLEVKTNELQIRTAFH